MIKKLTKHGNSHAIIIDRTMMEQLGITPDSPLHILISGDAITIRPANVGIGEQAVDEGMDDIRAKYPGLLDRLSK